MGSPPLGGRAAVAAAVLALAAGPAVAGDPGAGRQKASQTCQTCHGIDGLARMPEAPHIAGESEVYLRNQLEAFRSGRREHPIMSVVARSLTDEDIADLAAWYSSIGISVELPE